MVHGGPQGGPGGGADQFSEQASLAERGWRLVLPDRPGHGQSPSRGPEDFEADGTWVADLLGDGAHLVGHSYGGLVALAATALRPAGVRSLTLIETPLIDVAADDPSVRELRAGIDELSAGDRPGLERLIGFGQLIRIPPGAAGGPMPSMEQLTAMGDAIATMRSPTDWSAGGALDSIAASGIPVLVVTSGGLPALEAIAEATAERSGGQHVVVEADHHFPHRTGVPFNDVLETFLRSGP